MLSHSILKNTLRAFFVSGLPGLNMLQISFTANKIAQQILCMELWREK